jgi:hypothetical protein
MDSCQASAFSHRHAAIRVIELIGLGLQISRHASGNTNANSSPPYRPAYQWRE